MFWGDELVQFGLWVPHRTAGMLNKPRFQEKIFGGGKVLRFDTEFFFIKNKY